MEKRPIKLDEAAKISAIMGSFIIALSVAYYLVVFLPKQEAAKMEEQKKQETIQANQQTPLPTAEQSQQTTMQQTTTANNQPLQNGFLCNNKYFSGCPVGQQIYCPSTGDAMCHSINTKTIQSKTPQDMATCLTAGLVTLPKKKPTSDAGIRQYNEEVQINQQTTKSNEEYCGCFNANINETDLQLCQIKVSLQNLPNN